MAKYDILFPVFNLAAKDWEFPSFPNIDFLASSHIGKHVVGGVVQGKSCLFFDLDKSAMVTKQVTTKQEIKSC